MTDQAEITVVAESILVAAERQRKKIDRGPLDELKQSILERGLLHPLVVHYSLGDRYLMAGFRRLTAIKELHAEGHTIKHGDLTLNPGTVPVVLYSGLDKLAQYQIELEENMRRAPLSWQEQCAALAEIDRLLAMKMGKKPQRTEVAEVAAPVFGKGMKATRDTLSQATVVDAYLHLPEVASAQSLSKAYGVVAAIVEKEVMDAAATEEAPDAAPAPSRHALHHGDLTRIMPTLEERPNVIIADPPYGIDADKWSSGWATKHHYDDTFAAAQQLWDHIIDMGYAQTADNAHLYMFCDWRYAITIMDMMADRGWRPYPNPIIWQKGPVGYPSPHFGLRHGYECIVYAIKGEGTSRRVMDDVLYVPAGIQDKTHAAQKPVKLYVDLLARHVMPNDLILDPCCGSGTVFPAANTLHARAIGIEQNEAMYKVAEQTRRNADRPAPPTTPATALGDDEL